jgi:hypothetical protein
MAAKEKHTTAPGFMLLLMVLVNAIILKHSYLDASPDYRPLLVSLPLLAIALVNCFGNKQG